MEVEKLRRRAGLALGHRMTTLGARMSGPAVALGEVEAAGESVDVATLLRTGWQAPAVDALFYFPDSVAKIYQIEQWLPVIAAHSGDLSFGIVTRSKSAWMHLLGRELPAPSFLAAPFSSLMTLYRTLGPKAVIYPNNGLRNFQSLVWAEAAHIHVNHGESDKVSMVSNQIKAYDRIFVAGEAAVRRHRAALVDFDEHRLIRIGRPQLDLNPTPTIPASSRCTVMYAPTWEGEDEANNFTSLDRYGPAIVRALLSLPQVRVIYKPHPRVITSPVRAMAQAHSKCLGMLSRAALSDPDAGHTFRPDGDILALFPRVDLLVTDVSSVGLDFLYSRVEAPIVITDRRSDPGTLNRDAPIARAAHVIDSRTVGTAAQDIAALLAVDRYREDRMVLRRYYFDEIRPGDSTRRFHEALLRAIAEHQQGVAQMRQLARFGGLPAEAAEDSEVSADRDVADGQVAIG